MTETRTWSIVVSPHVLKNGRYSPKFDTRLECGCLIGVWRTPLFNAARYILENAPNADPNDLIVMRHAGSNTSSFHPYTLAEAAKLTVSEPDSGGGPTFTTWKPYPAPTMRPPAATSSEDAAFLIPDSAAVLVATVGVSEVTVLEATDV